MKAIEGPIKLTNQNLNQFISLITFIQDTKIQKKYGIEKFLIDSGAFNIASVSESKKISNVKKDSNNSMHTNIDIASALQSYSQLYIDENKRNNFVSLATELITLYKLEAKE